MLLLFSSQNGVFKIYFQRGRERGGVQAGEGQREEERESQAHSAVSAQRQMWVSNPQAMRSWPG